MKKVAILTISLVLFVLSGSMAQRSKKLFPTSGKTTQNKAGDTFLNKQWYLGLRGGINLTRAVPETRYSTLSPINFDEGTTDKDYEDFNKLAVQIGLDFTFAFNSYAISLQPTYLRERFTYGNQFSWQGTDGSLEMDLSQDTELEYLELPLSFKYQFLDGPLQPFVQIGAYYAFLVNANKSVNFGGVDSASGGSNEFDREEFSVGASDLFLTSSAGLIGGAGVHYTPGNVRLTFDILYRHGLHNVTDRKNRYSDNRLIGVGDVIDDLSLRNVSL